jgi:hypothetical protein
MGDWGILEKGPTQARSTYIQLHKGVVLLTEGHLGFENPDCEPGQSMIWLT